MRPIRSTRLVHAAPDRVFRAFTDFEHAAENVRGIERVEVLTPGVTGVGLRFRETRVMFKREATEEMEVTAWVPNERVVVSADSCGAHIDSEFRFTPEAEGTRVDLEMRVQPITLLAKLMAPLSGLMMKTALKQVEADIDDLAGLCEGRAAGPAEAIRSGPAS